MLLPSAHEQTELIEVVRISPDANDPLPKTLDGEDVAIWEGDEAREVLSLIKELPVSRPGQTFLPGWGLRAHGPRGMLFEFAFSYDCHAARVWGPAVPHKQEGLYPFDPDSPQAVELLRRFRACAQPPPA
ncbi:hypothetical protein ACQPZG_24760 [Streptomyces sp. CA-294286]|uniref:hypothetical protein n=1 Tax=Streptomyces sp. CA-294286 TaxID=3240070 RepID=UPI003D8E860B